MSAAPTLMSAPLCRICFRVRDVEVESPTLMWGKMASCGRMVSDRCGFCRLLERPITNRPQDAILPHIGSLALRTRTLRYQPFCRRIAMAPTVMSHTPRTSGHTSKVRTVCVRSASTGLCGVVSRMREKRNAVPEMKEDPAEPACRSRLQTTVSCCRPMSVVVNVTEKA